MQDETASAQRTADAVARAIYESAVEGTMREPESWEELEETAREPWRRNARAASLATIEWLATTPMPNATPGFADAFRRLMRRKEDEIEGVGYARGETARSERTDHWAVSVDRNGENIVTIESNCLSGRSLSKEDERVIRIAAAHLLAFIGDAPPVVRIASGPNDGEGIFP